MRFAVIDAKRADYPITVLCRALGVSRAGYYASVGRPPSAREVEDRRLAILVRESHERGRRFYGSPRVHLDLAKTYRVFVSRKRVIRIMQQEGLKARVRKRFKCTTMSDHDHPVAPNLLAQEFKADHPNRRWVGDAMRDGKWLKYLRKNRQLFGSLVLRRTASQITNRALQARLRCRRDHQDSLSS
ncbi:MAG TPA: IS3 family transposase [Anaeromyxobacter sp.]